MVRPYPLMIEGGELNEALLHRGFSFSGCIHAASCGMCFPYSYPDTHCCAHSGSHDHTSAAPYAYVRAYPCASVRSYPCAYVCAYVCAYPYAYV